VEGSSLLRSGFGKHEASVRKIKSREVPFAPKTSTQAPPLKTPGDHQMNEEPEFVFKTNGDAFADPLELKHSFVLDGRKRWLGGTQQKRIRNSHALQ
jgi:hypothetical protein